MQIVCTSYSGHTVKVGAAVLKLSLVVISVVVTCLGCCHAAVNVPVHSYSLYVRDRACSCGCWQVAIG